MDFTAKQASCINVTNITNRYIIVILALIISSILVHLLSYSIFNQSEKGLASIEKIPLDIEKWHGKEIPLDGRIYDILETKSIINRKYVSDFGDEVFLSIVYYPETKVDFHAPEGCLAGQGIDIEKSLEKIKIINDGKIFQIEVNKLIQKQSNNQESLIYYFYKAGNFMGSSYLNLRLNLVLNKFLSNEKSAALIRVSSALNSQNLQNNALILQKFIQDIIPYIIKL